MPDRAELRRRRIVEAARILFIDNGFHATGVAQIAKESGVAVGQIYRDFDTKEDIVAAIASSDCATFMARESLRMAIIERDSAAVWAWLRHFVASDDEDDGGDQLFAEIVAEAARNKRIAAIFADMRDDARTSLIDALTLLVPDDRLADRRKLLADIILTQSLGIIQHRLLTPDIDIGHIADGVMAAIGREIEGMRSLPADEDRRLTAA